jgi:hypothetical protein
MEEAERFSSLLFILGSCWDYFSALKMEVIYSSETSTSLQTAQHYSAEDCALHNDINHSIALIQNRTVFSGHAGVGVKAPSRFNLITIRR